MWNPWKLRRVFVLCMLIETRFSVYVSVVFSLAQQSFIPNTVVFCDGSFSRSFGSYSYCVLGLQNCYGTVNNNFYFIFVKSL